MFFIVTIGITLRRKKMPVYHRYIMTEGHRLVHKEISVRVCVPNSDEPDNEYIQKHGVLVRDPVVSGHDGVMDRHTAACSEVIRQYPAYSLSPVVIERVELRTKDQFGIIMPLELA
jgi:hypothetical protein